MMDEYKKNCIEYLKNIFNNINYSSNIKQYELLACKGLQIYESLEENFKRIKEFNNNSIIKLAHKVHYRILFNKDNIPNEYLDYSDEFNIYSNV